MTDEESRAIKSADCRWLRGRQGTLVLGGGGARGLAHLGAIQALMETGLEIQRIVGISIGALAGAMCGTRPDIISIQNEVIDMLTSSAFRRHQSQLFGAARVEATATNQRSDLADSPWYLKMKRIAKVRRQVARAAKGSSALPAKVLRGLVDSLVPDVRIEQLRYPLSIVAVDLLSGKRVVMESGSLRRAVLASASIPGVFPAVPTEGMLLADLGVVDSLPTMVARSYDPELTIAVDVGRSARSLTHCDSALDAILRVQSIAEQELRRNSLALADLVLRPDVRNAWFDFSDPKEVIRSSYEAVCEQLEQLDKASSRVGDRIAAPVATNTPPGDSPVAHPT